MMLSFFSHAGKAIAWTALDSLWQWGILWLSYSLLARAKSFEYPTVKYNLALLHYFTGVTLFLLYLYTHATGNPSFSLRNISLPELEQIGHSGQYLTAINISLGFIYLLACIIRFTRIMAGLHQIGKMKYHGEPILESWISGRAIEWQRKFGLTSTISLWISNKINGPVTSGFLKPVIFFPFCAVTNLSREELETLLLHEMMHVKRHDYLLNMIVQTTRCLVFFNPFSDLFIKAIETERELGVDDLVIGSIHNRLSYATALLAVQQSYSHPRLTINAASSEHQQLLMRIKRILNQPTEKADSNPRPILLPVLAGLLLWVMIAIPSQPIMVTKITAASKVERMITLTNERKRASSANPVMPPKTSQQLLAVSATQKRPKVKGIQSPADTAIALAEEKFIRVSSKDPVVANTYSIKKENRSFTYESNALDNSANPLLSPNEPFIPSNSFEKGKEDLSESAINNKSNAVAFRESMEQARLWSALFDRIQKASNRVEKIQLMLQWRKEMEKRGKSSPVKIKKIVVL